MAMWRGQNIQAQKMGRQVTGEGSLMLRLIETPIPGWLPLRVGKAIQHILWELILVPCDGLISSRVLDTLGRQPHLESAHLRQTHHGTDGLSESRSIGR